MQALEVRTVIALKEFACELMRDATKYVLCGSASHALSSAELALHSISRLIAVRIHKVCYSNLSDLQSGDRRKTE